jgi:hypothetical protein
MIHHVLISTFSRVNANVICNCIAVRYFALNEHLYKVRSFTPITLCYIYLLTNSFELCQSVQNSVVYVGTLRRRIF